VEVILSIPMAISVRRQRLWEPRTVRPERLTSGAGAIREDQLPYPILIIHCSIWSCVGRVPAWNQRVEWSRVRFRGEKSAKFPAFFPVSREFGTESRSR